MTDPLNHQTTFTYNAAGQPLTVTDALSKTTTFGYAMGNLVSMTSPLGHLQTRFVDGGGRLLRVTDPSGATTRFEYNPFSQVTTIVDPINGETSFTFLELAGPHRRSRALGGCAPSASRRRLTATATC